MYENQIPNTIFVVSFNGKKRAKNGQKNKAEKKAEKKAEIWTEKERSKYENRLRKGEHSRAEFR